MFSTWKLSKEVGQEEVDLVGEMEENKSKRLVGVPSSAPILSSEQLCRLVKSEYCIYCGLPYFVYLQVHSVPSDNPCEVCFRAWERWEFKKQTFSFLSRHYCLCWSCPDLPPCQLCAEATGLIFIYFFRNVIEVTHLGPGLLNTKQYLFFEEKN